MDISPKKIKMDAKELPLVLESSILARLPTKQVLGCQCICKRWCDEIRSPNFIKSHTQRNEDAKTSCSVILYPKLHPNPSSTKVFSMDLDQLLLLSPHYYNNNKNKNKNVVLSSSSSHCLPTNLHADAELIGSSKGLLCFRNVDSNSFKTLSFWLHNPATGACTNVPRLIPKKAQAPMVNFVKMLGFGHDSKTDDFKILCSLNYTVYGSAIRRRRSSDDEYSVYSLKSDSWKYIEPVGIKFKRVVPSILTLSNNALHCVGHANGLFGMYAFDLGTEKFHQVPLPYSGRLLCNPCLFDIKGCLHVTLMKFSACSIWVMKGYRSSKQSWTKLVDLDGDSLRKQVKLPPLTLKLWPLGYSEDGSQILIGIGVRLHIYAIFQCDLHSRQVNKLLPPPLSPNPNCDHSQKVEPFDFPCRVMPWSASLRNPY